MRDENNEDFFCEGFYHTGVNGTTLRKVAV